MPPETTVNDKVQNILDALIRCGPGWHGRSEIARQLGKRRLNEADALLLDILLERGEIEAERREIDAPIRERWEYQIVKKHNMQGKLEFEQVHTLADRYLALLKQLPLLPGEAKTTQRELKTVEKELRALGYRMEADPDGDLYPSPIPPIS